MKILEEELSDSTATAVGGGTRATDEVRTCCPTLIRKADDRCSKQMNRSPIRKILCIPATGVFAMVERDKGRRKGNIYI
jgi:hypothetical protein